MIIVAFISSCNKGTSLTDDETVIDDEGEVIEKKPDVTVAKDGTGDFITVQEAVDRAPSGRKEPYIIFIKEGTYEEIITVPKSKNFLLFKGEDARKTILTFGNYASKLDPNSKEYGTSGSASVFIKGDDFSAENISFENSAGMTAGQALAINISGNRAAFKDCRFLGHQDTFYAGNGTKQYLKNCYIEGTVDFMFGGSTAVFEDCIIHSLRDGYLTAASTPEGQKYGYVFINSKLTAAEGVKAASVYLGRPWRPNSNVVFVNCEMGQHIRPEGWHNWGNPDNERTAFYAEYKSKGDGYKEGKRVSWSKQLTDEMAKEYTKEKILESWKPFY